MENPEEINLDDISFGTYGGYRYNFSDLTPDSQREIWIKNMAFDIAANWVAKFSGMPIATARAALLGSAILESQQMSEEAIATFWSAIDHPDQPVIN